MRRKLFAFSLLLSVLFSVSCIREEALNAEADILACTLEGNVLNREAIISNDQVILQLKKSTDVTKLAPQFVLTPGATITPESGSVHDFSTPQTYVVTSEDRAWKKAYTVMVTTSTNVINHFSFEEVDWKLNHKGEKEYQILYYTNPFTSDRFAWGSGNAGYAMTGMAKSASDYPTYQSVLGGFDKRCAVLTTRKTGSFGAMANMPIAAGNLFIGTFDVDNALTNSLKATRFGMPWGAAPKRIHGWFKYRSGDTFYELDKSRKDKMREVPGKRDQFNIYAVFYEVTDDMKTLDGENYMSEDNQNIVSVAQIAPEDVIETEEWTNFSIDFKYRAGKTIDQEKLENGLYNLAIVFTSSVHGDTFSGAPDSMLQIDEVHLDYED